MCVWHQDEAGWRRAASLPYSLCSYGIMLITGCATRRRFTNRKGETKLLKYMLIRSLPMEFVDEALKLVRDSCKQRDLVALLGSIAHRLHNALNNRPVPGAPGGSLPCLSTFGEREKQETGQSGQFLALSVDTSHGGTYMVFGGSLGDAYLHKEHWLCFDVFADSLF